MLKIVKYALAINIIIVLIFVYSNLSLWSIVNGKYPYLIASHWSPYLISAPHYFINNGSIAVTQTIYLYFNAPFWVFWVLLITNLYFILKIGREARETKLDK